LKTTGYNHASLGLVAQLVEQRIENPCVGGSIPPRATKNIKRPGFGWVFFVWAIETQPAVSTRRFLSNFFTDLQRRRAACA
jgi:hypothetical protein